MIGAWTTAALPRTRLLSTNPTFNAPGDEPPASCVQVSRLGMPLVNEVVIGLKDKNRFNASHPSDDCALRDLRHQSDAARAARAPVRRVGVRRRTTSRAPTWSPRSSPASPGSTSSALGEMLRLNTSIPPTPKAAQNNLGVLGGDNAGFPNGRRPGDDVVDIELRVAMGVLCHAFPGVSATRPTRRREPAVHRRRAPGREPVRRRFPYLTSPIPGSPNSVNGVGEY